MNLLISKTASCIILAILLAINLPEGDFYEILQVTLFLSTGVWIWELVQMLKFNRRSLPTKAINIGNPEELEKSDLPPELKKVLGNFAKNAKKVEKTLNKVAHKKCDDPHCDSCWGLSDKGNNHEK